MPYLIECDEWRLLHCLGLFLSQRNSLSVNQAVNPTVDSESDADDEIQLLREVFKMELEHFLLPDDCPRLLSTAEFDECGRGLKDLCGLLDRIVHPKLVAHPVTKFMTGYPHLRFMVGWLDSLELSGSEQTFDLISGSQRTLFTLPADSELDDSITLVTGCRDLLAGYLSYPTLEAWDPWGSAVLDDEVEAPATCQVLRRRRQAVSALKEVFQHLGCGAGHEVMLNVSEETHSTVDPILDLRLSSCLNLKGSTDTNKWLQVEARCGSIRSGWKAALRSINDMCVDLESPAAQASGEPLILAVQDYGFFGGWTRWTLRGLRPPPPDAVKTNLHSLLSSGAFRPLGVSAMKGDSEMPAYSLVEKRALAVRLGRCFLDFFDTGLSSERIYLPHPSRAASPTLDLLFTSNQLATTESYKSIFNSGHHGLTSFAKLLLDLEFGESIDVGHNFGPDRVTANQKTWQELRSMVDRLELNRPDHYVQAIRGCLEAYTEISLALQHDAMEDPELTIRDLLYTAVVEKLEAAHKHAILDSKRMRSPTLEQMPQPRPPIAGGKRQPSGAGSSSLGVRLQLLRSHSAPGGTANVSRTRLGGSEPPSRADVEIAPTPLVGLFDDSTPNEYPPELCMSADGFVWRHQEDYRDNIEETQQMHRVKVAILDTGVDKTHPRIRGSVDRIKGEKSWLPENRRADVDASGHGTHITALLLAIAPDSDVYIARIADSHPISPGEIAKAITYAVDDWQVDMITMSFGFRDEKEHGCSELRDAILKAHASKVLLFAAASNDGAHGAAPAFPARMSNVFAIYSGDGMGNSTRTNPNPVKNRDNFLTLGEAVESAWPKALSGGGSWTRRKSGTSFATPIAAGIAAFLLLYAYQSLPLGHAQKFKEHDKMRDWLLHLSNERQGYQAISVQTFFRRDPEARRMIMMSILDGTPVKA